MADSWRSRHFCLANAVTDDVTDLPHLLRRVANEMEKQGITPMELLDVTVHSESASGVHIGRSPSTGLHTRACTRDVLATVTGRSRPLTH